MSNDQLFASPPTVRLGQLHWGMSCIVTKTIKGRQYRYLQRSYRDGGKVKVETIYLGPVDGVRRRKPTRGAIGAFIAANLTRSYGLPDEETLLREYNAHVERERADRDKLVAKLHELYGLRLSPTNPPPAPTAAISPNAPEMENAPSVEGATTVSTPTPTAP